MTTFQASFHIPTSALDIASFPHSTFSTSPMSNVTHLHSTSDSFNSSSTPPSNETCNPDQDALRLPLALFYTLFFILGLVGNLLALGVFLSLHSRRNSVRVFLINVAVADLLLLGSLPFRVLYHANGDRWDLGQVACNLVGNVFYMNMYISIILLGFISLDRYMKLRAQGGGGDRGLAKWIREGGWSWGACAALWGLALMAVVPMIAMSEGNEEAGKCFQYKQRTGARWKAYFNMGVVGMFWAVFGLLVVSYGNIATRLLKVARDKPDLPNARRYGRTARKSFFVLFLFTVCFGPYHAFRPVYILSQLSQQSCQYQRLVDRTNEVMLLFSAFNSVLDPVMYFLLSGSVRKATFKALGQSLGNRLHLHNEGTSNSSVSEIRHPTLSLISPNSAFNSSHTPSLSQINQFLISGTQHS